MKVFISHSWKDKLLATEINERLQADGHEVWYDIHQLVPGDDIQDVIDVYIKKCDVVVLVWSVQAFGSAGVDAEIQTACSLNKRIIPLQKDHTPLAHHQKLKGLLGIPFDDVETGMLLLQRCLLMLSADDGVKQSPWFKEAFDNVIDLGGYLNYINTFYLKNSKGDEGKEQWVARITDLKNKNDFIRTNLMPEAQDKMITLQAMMKELEKGDVALDKLNEWKQWCDVNKSFQPELMTKLAEFIDNDIKRLSTGGTPVSTLNVEMVEQTTARLEQAILNRKDAAYSDLSETIKKYGGLFMGEKTINTIVSGYLNYVTKSPQLLRELLNEAKLSEFVAVKEAVVMLANHLETQDHGLEMRKKNLEGYFDDAYLINNTIKLLIDADLVAKNNFTLDFVSINIVDKYVSLILNKQTKTKLDELLKAMQTLIGYKKKEINWSQVAALVIGVAALQSGVGYLGGLSSNTSPAPGGNSGNGDGSPYFEDRMAAMSAKFGGGLNIHNPIQY